MELSNKDIEYDHSYYKGKSLSDEDIKYLFSTDSEDITMSWLKNNFAFTLKNAPRFNPQDTFMLPKDKLFNDKPEFTTVGRYVFNRLILDTKIGPIIKYQNYPIDENALKNILSKLKDALLEKQITNEDFFRFIDKGCWFGYGASRFINASLNSQFLLTDEDVAKRKEELFDKYKNEIKNKDAYAVSLIENELLDIAKEKFKDEPSMQIYSSGSRGSFGNNYKNSSIMRGVIKDFADDKEMKISASSLEEGIKPEEIAAYSNMAIAGEYGKAVETQKGGAENKVMVSSFQSVVADKKDSDCGSKKLLEVELKGSNYDMFKYRFIYENGKFIELNDTNKDKYMNKFIKIRSPLFCKSDKFCNRCLGNLYYKEGIENIGLLTIAIGGVILNNSMKSFHDSTVKLAKINIEDYIFE